MTTRRSILKSIAGVIPVFGMTKLPASTNQSEGVLPLADKEPKFILMPRELRECVDGVDTCVSRTYVKVYCTAVDG